MTSAAAARRERAVEILDAGDYAGGEVRGNLDDLRRYNRWLGGSRLTARAVAPLLRRAGGPGAVTLLDVATGLGDVPSWLSRWAGARGVPVLAGGIDVNPDVLREARAFQRRRPPSERVRLARAEATSLPHADGSVDVVVCHNFLHHLTSEEAVRVLSEMRRVCRLGVAAVDLVRSRAAWACVWALTRISTRNRLTRHDGPLSVERAFTVEEVAGLSRRAGMEGARVRRAGASRLLLTWTAPRPSGGRTIEETGR